MRRAVLLTAALLGSCAPAARDVSAPIVAANPPACGLGQDGGPPVSLRWAERGIGGTGGPASTVRQADRGIGGTGAPSATSRQADRGIGGTGIVGVVTGFASVCLAGREVALDDAIPVRMNGEASSPADLRAGQLAAVDAAGIGATLQARSVFVRHEVIGPVEAVEGNGDLRVAGQRVVVAELASSAPGSAEGLRPGEWVAVSGLRGPDDVIRTTRLDRRPPGTALVRGILTNEAGTLRIGTLVVQPTPESRTVAGQTVTASGRYEGGVLYADTLAGDVLAENPAAFFGGGVRTFVLEGYVAAGDGRLRFGQGLDAAAPTGTGPFAPRRAVVEFQLEQNGSLRATALSDVGAGSRGPAGPARGPGAGQAPGGSRPSAGARSGGSGGPAPVPSRTFERAPVPDRTFGGRPGDSPGGSARSGAGGPGGSPAAGRAGFSPAQSGGSGPGGPAGGGGPGR